MAGPCRLCRNQLALGAQRGHIYIMKPSVGMAATIQIGTDLYGATVIDVSPSGHRVTVQQDKARGPLHVLGLGRTEVFTRRHDGHYRKLGCSYVLLSLGERITHLDPNF